MANSSSTLNSRPGQRAVSARALWLLPIGILLVEAALRLMPEGFMERTLDVRMAEIISMPGPRVQIMGDSVAAGGVDAANVAESAGLPTGSVQNYSLPGTSPMFAYFTLQRELAAGRVPGRIIFAPHPGSMKSPKIDRFMGRFATARESVGLLKHGVPLTEWLFGAACRASVAMNEREEFRLAVTQGDFGFFATLMEAGISVHYSQIKITQAAPPKVPVLFTPATIPAELEMPFSVDRINALYIDEFCSLAAKHGIQVAWVTVPVLRIYNEVAMGGAGGAGEAKFQAYLDALAARHPNVILLRRKLEVYPDNCFNDPWHLNPYGALLFSRELGKALGGAPSKGAGQISGGEAPGM